MKNIFFTTLSVLIIAISSCKTDPPKVAEKPTEPLKPTLANPMDAQPVSQEIIQYFRDLNIKEAQATTTGMAFVVQKQGSGKPLKMGDKVTVNYSGKLTNGQEFDSSKKRGSITFKIGQMVPGFNQACLLLKRGGKGTFAIPPSLGYGEKTTKDPSGKVIIPPGSTLVFDLEIIK